MRVVDHTSPVHWVRVDLGHHREGVAELDVVALESGGGGDHFEGRTGRLWGGVGGAGEREDLAVLGVQDDRPS
jgi:hypothetical protein